MDQIIITNKNGDVITSVEEWEIKAPPAHDYHWKDGRSAKELAKYWINCRPSVPKQIDTLLQNNSLTVGIKLHSAMAEKKTTFDEFRGNVRNHDLLLNGKIGNTNIVIGIEAKVDETFGDTIVAQQLEIVKTKPTSNTAKRVNLLSLAFWGKEPDEQIKCLRYQLLTSLAGTIAEAKEQKATMAILLIHEFYNEVQNAPNLKALELFIQTFKPEFAISSEPFLVEIGISQSNDFLNKDVKILIGKFSTKINKDL